MVYQLLANSSQVVCQWFTYRLKTCRGFTDEKDESDGVSVPPPSELSQPIKIVDYRLRDYPTGQTAWEPILRLRLL